MSSAGLAVMYLWPLSVSGQSDLHVRVFNRASGDCRPLHLSLSLSLSLLLSLVFLSAHWPCLVHIAFLTGCGIMTKGLLSWQACNQVACLAMLIVKSVAMSVLCLFLSFSISLSLKKNLAWPSPLSLSLCLSLASLQDLQRKKLKEASLVCV